MSVRSAEVAAYTPAGQRTRQQSDAERRLRVELAAAYRLVDHFGWTEQIYGHLTARIPGADNHFLINAFGENYDEVTASGLVKIDVDGNAVDNAAALVSYAGFVIHSAIHMCHEARNQVVMHIHSRAGMAIAAIQEGLLPISMSGGPATIRHADNGIAVIRLT